MIPASLKEEYPFEPRSLDLGGATMSYLDEGPEDGEPIVMLHGNPTWSFYYRKLVLALRDRYRVVVPDHVGSGLSSKPQSYRYTLATHIGNVTKLVETLGLKEITLAFHDWGGAIGMGYAVAHPANVKRFVVFNTAAFLSSRIPPSIDLCRTPLIGEAVMRGLNGFLGAALHLGFATSKPERYKGAVRKGYLHPYRNWRDRVGIARFVQDIPMKPNHPSYVVLRDIQQKLHLLRDKPAVIFWGMDDFCFTEHFLERWIQYFPEAEVHTYESVGHWVVEDAHEKIIPPLTAFLKCK